MPLELPEFQFIGIAPETALVVAALVTLVVHAVLGERRGHWYLPVLATAGLAASIYLALQAWGRNHLSLADMVAVDGFSVFCKVTLAVFGLLTVWLGRDYLGRERLEESEFHALVLFAVAGMMLMASAADLIMVFLALETFSLALYVLVAYRRESLQAQESSMKYFLLGAFSSAFFLLGIALVYGAVGSTNLYGGTTAPGGTGVAAALATTPGTGVGLLVVATAFLIVGLGFKVAAVPFHMWTPDAYQGAPSPVTGLMAAGTKLAGFAALLRLLDVTLFPLRADWRPLLIGVAIATMVAGSLLAVVQTDVKRLLAYSSIAHAGFVLTGIIAANDAGVAGSLFYLATYGLTVLGAFAVVAVVAGREERRVTIDDYRGMFYERPALAGALTLFLLSLAGVPATSGFVAKLVVFGPAVDAGYWWLVVVGALASAVAAFFYLKILVAMYMQERSGPVPGTPGGGLLGAAAVALAAVGTVLFGLWWGPLIRAAESATLFYRAAGF